MPTDDPVFAACLWHVRNFFLSARRETDREPIGTVALLPCG